MALGIGANTAIFSVLDALLLRRVPVERPDQRDLLHGLSSDYYTAPVDVAAVAISCYFTTWKPQHGASPRTRKLTAGPFFQRQVSLRRR